MTLIRGGGPSPAEHAALGRRRRRRGVVCWCRHRLCRRGPQARGLHAQLSEPDPAAGAAIRRIAAALAPFAFDMMFSNFFESVIERRSEAGFRGIGRALLCGDRAGLDLAVAARTVTHFRPRRP